MENTQERHYVLSFDLDFTLANFELTPFVKLAQQALIKALVLHKGYPQELLVPESLSRSCSGECFRAVYDAQTLNLLKIGALGQVLSAFHAWNKLTKDQLIQVYGELATIPLTATKPKDASGRFKYFEDYFLNYITAPLREIAHLRSGGNAFLAERSGQQILDEFYSTAEQNYDFVLLADEKTGKPREWVWPNNFGYFYPELISQAKNIMPAISDKLVDFITNKPKNVHPVIVSNGSLSHFLPVAKGLELAGSGRIFDAVELIALAAEKPGFFGSTAEGRPLNLSESDPDEPTIPNLWPEQSKRIRIGGGLTSLLKQLQLGDSDPVTFIHVGDSSTTDLGWEKPSIPGLDVVKVGICRELADSRPELIRIKPINLVKLNPEALEQRIGAEAWGSGLQGVSDVDGSSYPTLGYAIFERSAPKLFSDINSPDLLSYLQEITRN